MTAAAPRPPRASSPALIESHGAVVGWSRRSSGVRLPARPGAPRSPRCPRTGGLQACNSVTSSCRVAYDPRDVNDTSGPPRRAATTASAPRTPVPTTRARLLPDEQHSPQTNLSTASPRPCKRGDTGTPPKGSACMNPSTGEPTARLRGKTARSLSRSCWPSGSDRTAYAPSSPTTPPWARRTLAGRRRPAGSITPGAGSNR